MIPAKRPDLAPREQAAIPSPTSPVSKASYLNLSEHDFAYAIPPMEQSWRQGTKDSSLGFLANIIIISTLPSDISPPTGRKDTKISVPSTNDTV